jgi:hypothetical protein
MAVVAGGALLLAAVAPVGSVSAQQRGDDLTKNERTVLSMGGQVADKGTKTGARPSGPNPYLALVPDPSAVDYAGWDRYLEAKSQARAVRMVKQQAQRQVQRALAQPILVDEDEPDGIRGGNDSPATAQPIPGFGTRNQDNFRARILGNLSPEPVSVRAIPASTEDDGSIPLARDTGIPATDDAVSTTGTIGDGPHGSAGSDSGDFDVYALDAVPGETITVDVDTPTGPLDSMLILYNAAGEIVAFNDDFDGLDSLLSYPVTEAGTYYVFVSGFAALPTDPFDSGSGDGAGSEGPYGVTISAAEFDLDYYAVRLRKGDVLGTSVEGNASMLTLVDPNGVNVHGSPQDASALYPLESPLPGGGNAVSEHVADETGWHYIGVSNGDGSYDVTVEAYRPGLEGKRPVQTLFLDFDGARVNTAIWGGPGVVQLSPLRAFLGRWGLTNADLNPLINRVVAEVRENIEADLAASGLNQRFRVRITNSRDHADTFGDPNVSRIIIGGTIDESGVDTIGIAESIDPGNYGTEETALVLLDLVSDPAGPSYSFNTYLTSGGNKLRFIGQALGNVTSHEGGHYFGSWHVDQFNDVLNLMDQGGNFPLLYGVGPDGVGGTADDPDVDFGEDEFNPGEGFTGIEDTLTRTEFGLTR